MIFIGKSIHYLYKLSIIKSTLMLTPGRHLRCLRLDIPHRRLDRSKSSRFLSSIKSTSFVSSLKFQRLSGIACDTKNRVTITRKQPKITLFILFRLSWVFLRSSKFCNVLFFLLSKRTFLWLLVTVRQGSTIRCTFISWGELVYAQPAVKYQMFPVCMPTWLFPIVVDIASSTTSAY